MYEYDPSPSPCLVFLNPSGGLPLVLDDRGKTVAWERGLKPSATLDMPPIRRSRDGGIVVVDSSAPDTGVSYSPGSVWMGTGRPAVVCNLFKTKTGPVIELAGFCTATPSVVDVMAWAVLSGYFGVDVLIVGPSGTGKESLARMVRLGRKSRLGCAGFAAVNMAALTPSLACSELFGHVRGAFTGATQSSVGAFRTVADGVLFLDEVGEAPSDVQAALLRALEQRQVRPVGQVRTVPFEGIVVGATNRERGEDGTVDGLRRDFQERLSGTILSVPGLKDRPMDIRPIGIAILDELRTKGLFTGGLAVDAWIPLMKYTWPGNVRELKHVLRRAALRTLGRPLDGQILSDTIASNRGGKHLYEKTELSLMDREILRIGLLRPADRGLARRRLGISKSTFYRKLRRLETQRRSSPLRDEMMSPNVLTRPLANGMV
ncbi:MAG: hypothetical protein CMH54_01085 [Myxococcales bacterium]|nr:hypothetical protein [Myxococcales bacterium]